MGQVINVRQGMAEVRKMKEEGYSLNMLAVAIGEAYSKFDATGDITLRERFLLGLRYSEFLAVGDTDDDYVMAAVKRDEYLKVLGIDVSRLNRACKEICGLN